MNTEKVADAELLGALGFTQEQLQERFLTALVDKATDYLTEEEEGDDEGVLVRLQARLDAKISACVETRLDAICESIVPKIISSRVDDAKIQRTNSWGGKVGDPMSFNDYLVQMSEEYMDETVNGKGMSKRQHTDRNEYGHWSGGKKRAVHMLDVSVSEAIRSAGSSSLKALNDSVSEGVGQVVQEKIREALEALQK